MLTSRFSRFISNKKPAKRSLASIFSLIVLLLNCSISLATENQEVYKIRLNVEMSPGSADYWNLNGREGSEEWVVIKVTDKKEFKIYHATYLENKTWGTRQWFDHPVTAMRVCLADGFEKKNCQVVNSDTATMSEGVSIYDLSIDFKYSEGGRSFTKNIVLSKDAKPE